MSAREEGQISDAKTMRALAHPVRMALLDILRDEGEVTASRAAELLGDSPGNMSWHLQTLAKYGFVEETGTGKGRSRPWRLVKKRISFSTGGPGETSETAAAGEALEEALLNRAFDQIARWRRTRDQHPDWSRTSFMTNTVLYLTPDQLDTLSAELQELLGRYDRFDPTDRPAGSTPVKFFGAGHPLISERGPAASQ